MIWPRGSLPSLASASATVLLTLSVGCTAAGGAPDFASMAFSQLGGAGGPNLPDRPRPSPQAGGDLLSASDLFALYETVMDVYVDPVEPRALVTGAVRGAHEGAVDAGLLPVETAVFDTAEFRFSGNAQADWVQWSRLYDSFLRKLIPRVNVQGVGQGAAEGMLEALDDPNTMYLTRRQVERLGVSDYVGVGVILAPTGQTGPPVVREVTAGSPAEAAGLQVGDLVLAVGARSTQPMSLVEVVDAIRGAEGTQVMLTVRSPQAETREVEVRRGVVRAAGVASELREGANYVRLRVLQEGAANAVRTTLLQSPSGTRGWVLDLRGNDRGSLPEAVNLASLFVGEQTVALQEDRVRRRAPIRGVGRPISPQLPVVILVDEGTGGGAELFAAALRDHGMARIVGTKTSGKVARTTQVPLPDGAVAQITSHRLLSPSGGQLHRVGLMPDETVEARAEDWIAGRDIQLERALARLSG